MKNIKGTAAFLLGVALAGAAAESGAGQRAAVERALKERYRLTVVGTGMLGFTGTRATIQQAGGVLGLRRAGLSGSLNPDQPATFHIRNGQPTPARGAHDYPLPVGERFFLHSVYVGSDVIVLGLLSTRTVSTPRGSGPVWLALNFFFPPATLAEANLGQVFAALDQWLLPEEGIRPVLPEAAPAPAPEPPPPPPPPADLKAGMSRDAVVAALGAPQREVSFGARTWLTYAGLVVVLEQGKLTAVDRSGQPPAKVQVVSEPDGADVYLDGSFVSSTPATLELPAGTYQVSVRLPGYREWQRELRVLAGSELTVRARLEK
jgi:hypothetical protein